MREDRASRCIVLEPGMSSLGEDDDGSHKPMQFIAPSLREKTPPACMSAMARTIDRPRP